MSSNDEQTTDGEPLRFLTVKELLEQDPLADDPLRDYFVWWDRITRSDADQLEQVLDEACRTPRTAEEAAEPALYAHKLTVARAYAGRGLGAELLDWAGSRAAAAGARWLRIDVWTTKRKLQRYYLAQGFTHVRTVELAHNPSGALFQRPARQAATPRLREASAEVAARLR